MVSKSEKQINLKTLQRVDSNIIEILDTASQVAIYKYDTKLGEWKGTDIEGTLFLYRRSVAPKYSFIIVNRLNTSNFTENITLDMQFQLQAPYLLYKNHFGDIIGSWFYEQQDLKRIMKKIQSILSGHNIIGRRRSISENESKSPEPGNDILTLLSKAHTTFMRQESLPNHIEDYSPVSRQQERKAMEKTLDKKISPIQEHQTSPRRRFVSMGSLDLSTNFPLKFHNTVQSKEVSQNKYELEKTQSHQPVFKSSSFDDCGNISRDFSKVGNSQLKSSICRKDLFNNRPPMLMEDVSLNLEQACNEAPQKLVQANKNKHSKRHSLCDLSKDQPSFISFDSNKNDNQNFFKVIKEKIIKNDVSSMDSVFKDNIDLSHSNDNSTQDSGDLNDSSYQKEKEDALNFLKNTLSKKNTFFPSTRTHLSPLISREEIASPLSDVETSDYSFDFQNSKPFQDPLLLLNWNPDRHGEASWQSAMGSEPNKHFDVMRNIFTSYMQDNPQVVPKIHDAYVSSLHSLFTKS